MCIQTEWWMVVIKECGTRVSQPLDSEDEAEEYLENDVIDPHECEVIKLERRER